MKYTAATRKVYRIAYEVYIAYEYTRSTARLNNETIPRVRSSNPRIFKRGLGRNCCAVVIYTEGGRFSPWARNGEL